MTTVCPQCCATLKCGCHICHWKNRDDDHWDDMGNGVKTCSVCGFTAYDSEWIVPKVPVYSIPYWEA
jgi:hypothetical protein